MAGGLAALFVAGKPAAATADAAADAVTVSQPVTLIEVLDALRATKDGGTVLKGNPRMVQHGNPKYLLCTSHPRRITGLRNLRNWLKGADPVALPQAQSELPAVLDAIWDAQGLVGIWPRRLLSQYAVHYIIHFLAADA